MPDKRSYIFALAGQCSQVQPAGNRTTAVQPPPNPVIITFKLQPQLIGGNRNTVEFLGLWEVIYNPNFKHVEFDTFRKQAGLNNFNLTPKKWIETTNAIGVISKSGRYGGTYAHKDLAFEFGSWISPMFKLLLIKEFQRLKEIEYNQYNLEWNVKRILTKANYSIHTDAVKDYLLPNKNYDKESEWLVYAEEAD